MTAGTGREPAAERGELERLGEVPKRQAMRPQLIFERGPIHAGLDARGARQAIHLDDTIECAQVDADGAAVVVADVALDTTDHRRSTAIGDGGDARVAAPVEERDDVVFVRGIATTSGGCAKSRCNARHTSRKDLP